ncbi:penicillin-binding protein 2 [Candidatus Bipolaricaulota bacterium]|nr:penicillin-binding protein 2 [Candidatus Bipolaricaulota bacterium]
MMRNPNRKAQFPTRPKLVASFFVFVGLCLVGRLVQLQIVEHDRWATYATNIQEVSIELIPQRGTIYDRNGLTLAEDIKAMAIAVDSYNMTRPETLISILESNLSLDKDELRDLIYRPSYFTWIDRTVDLDVALQIRDSAAAAGVGGLVFFDTWKRSYPQGTLASNVLGFVGTDGCGLEGIELAFDDWLTGEPTVMQFVTGADGRTYQATTVSQGMAGHNLTLTLDATIQLACEEEIDRGTDRFQANFGLMLVMDPNTGAVLAMAQSRRYDPNRFSDSSPEDRRNLAVTHLFEPGSSFKAFSAAAALDAGTVDLDDRFNGNDAIIVGGHTIHNADFESFGQVTLAEIIESSINTGMVQVALNLGAAALHATLVDLGFGSETGIELPGEEQGILRDPDQWVQLDLASTSIGQSVAVTGIQLIAAMTAIANGGQSMPCSIIETDAGIEAIREPHRALSPSTCTTMQSLLFRVVESGTGQWAKIPGFQVAGKTGTAQKAIAGQGYVEGFYTSLFAGFVPAFEPQLVALVVFDEVQTIPVGGGYTAGQVFRSAMSRIVQLERIPPLASAGEP